ncbi:discoidin, CUB and LCCL domain-containing protein 1-like [Platysternon megacephalum]|uniref:Discoidin, CUB and LCCL domain-containing protein 1-like n=1 Tax=Platysternon megacephalum TaxID=55544 RepID=A0A4D9F7J0_9SAUR|nr:discoidin, CUB and LCCL domain-containing protein 1-like [Platysternon megacephalum]
MNVSILLHMDYPYDSKNPTPMPAILFLKGPYILLFSYDLPGSSCETPDVASLFISDIKVFLVWFFLQSQSLLGIMLHGVAFALCTRNKPASRTRAQCDEQHLE